MSKQYPADLGGGGEKQNDKQPCRKESRETINDRSSVKFVLCETISHQAVPSSQQDKCSNSSSQKQTKQNPLMCKDTLILKRIETVKSKNCLTEMRTSGDQKPPSKAVGKSRDQSPGCKIQKMLYASNKVPSKALFRGSISMRIKSSNVENKGSTQLQKDSAVLRGNESSSSRPSSILSGSHHSHLQSHELRDNKQNVVDQEKSATKSPSPSKTNIATKSARDRLTIRNGLLNESQSLTKQDNSNSNSNKPPVSAMHYPTYSDSQLPPIKMLKTPSQMRELVSNTLGSIASLEPLQLPRRFYVKLPPLAKKPEIEAITAKDIKSKTGRKIDCGRYATVNQRNINRNMTVDRSGKNISTDGNARPARKVTTGQQAREKTESRQNQRWK